MPKHPTSIVGDGQARHTSTATRLPTRRIIQDHHDSTGT